MLNNLSRRRQVPTEEMDRMTERLEVPYPGTECAEFKTIRVIKNENNVFSAPDYWRGEPNMTLI